MGDMEHKQKCAEINVYCGDKDHRKHKKECCDPCKGLENESSFVSGADSGEISPVATEIATELLVNPIGSGKKLIIYKRAMSTLGSDDHAALFRYYLDPVLTSSGVLGSSVNLNTSSIGVSVAQFYTAPIVTSNGVGIDAFNTGVVPIESDVKIILAEGHSLLVTVRTNAEGVHGASFLYYQECMIRVDHDDDDDSGQQP